MTGVRRSMVFAPESTYGGDHGDWISAPPGTSFSHVMTRSLTKLRAVGHKAYENTAWGRVSGTWQWVFMLDLGYLEPLTVAFGKYTKRTTTVPHRFEHSETVDTGSFTVRIVQLDKVADGATDEYEVLRGCVCDTVDISETAGSGTVSVSMSGTYMSLENRIADDIQSQYEEKTSLSPVRYMCMYVGDDSAMSAFGIVDAFRISIGTNPKQIFGVFSPFATAYYEDELTFRLSASVYSNDPSRVRMRLNTGGSGTSDTMRVTGMKAMPKAELRATDEDGDETFVIHMEDISLKSLEYSGDHSTKIVDQLSSQDCRNMYITVDSDVEDYSDKHRANVPKEW